MPEGMSLCKICKEPIWGFFCLDCLAGDIEKLIPSSVKEHFKSFHKGFTFHFNNFIEPGFEACLGCRSQKEGIVCPYCYINEVMSWISDSYPNLAKKLSSKLALNFDAKKFDGAFRNTRLVPVIQNRCTLTDTGICERCEGYGETLMCSNGMWVCEGCRENTKPTVIV